MVQSYFMRLSFGFSVFVLILLFSQCTSFNPEVFFALNEEVVQTTVLWEFDSIRFISLDQETAFSELHVAMSFKNLSLDQEKTLDLWSIELITSSSGQIELITQSETNFEKKLLSPGEEFQMTQRFQLLPETVIIGLSYDRETFIELGNRNYVFPRFVEVTEEIQWKETYL
jgi:hypothetical protein